MSGGGVYRLQFGPFQPPLSRELAEAGFLLTYGADLRDLYRRSAVFVDKIFKGAKLPTCRSNNRPSSNW